MPDIIHLLSDHLANQIAAGEVIQRPASAVKELLENSIDAGATSIQLHLRDAGKELIQVVDNGKGMSPADARMAFERHATSKITNINDLFSIRTMGFRGEALASIAAVAQVELRTCPQDAGIGTRIVIEGTELKSSEAFAAAKGSSIAVKNLFFNVPARRHFLKSNTTELRHIIDEFTRVAMAHPQIAFRMFHNDAEQFNLQSGNLKTRIVELLGKTYERNLVPAEEDADVLKIHGFIGKPDAATRTRGAQFFFINNRYIRNAYLNHAVLGAYERMIDKDSYPFYVLFLEVDPARVDVNVHPTKQEVKFEDDRLMYAYLNAAVKHALARYNIAPSLDFSLNPEIQQLSAVQLPNTGEQQRETEGSYLYQSFTKANQAHRIAPSGEVDRWKSFYESARSITPDAPATEDFPAQTLPPAQITMPLNNSNNDDAYGGGQQVLLVQNSLLVTTVKSGLLVVHFRRASERIWYERLEAQMQSGNASSQRLLFPTTLELAPADAALLEPVLEDLRPAGLDIEPFGAGTFVVQGVPPGLPDGQERALVEDIIERMKHSGSTGHDRRGEILLSVAAKMAATAPPNGQEAMRMLIDELFACAQPEITATGKKVFSVLPRGELDALLG